MRTRRSVVDIEAEGIVSTGAPLRSAECSSAAGLQGMVERSGISLRLWRLYAQAWLVCLLFPILALVQLRPNLPQLVLALAGLALFVISYTWVMWAHPVRSVLRWPAHVARYLLLLAGLT